MSLFANSADIKTVTANATDILRVYHNGSLVWQKFNAKWDGVDSIVEGAVGFNTNVGNSMWAVFGGTQASVAVVVNSDGVFSGTSEYSNSSGGTLIKAVPGGLQVAHKIATVQSTWSPTITFDLLNGFNGGTIGTIRSGEISGESVGLTVSGFAAAFTSNTRFAIGTGSSAVIS